MFFAQSSRSESFIVPKSVILYSLHEFISYISKINFNKEYNLEGVLGKEKRGAFVRH